MILGRPLTPAERKSSQRNYNLFNLINGASYMCLGENVLILFAVHLGAPNTFVALLGSMMFLGYLVMPLGVLRTAKVGAAACQADFWVCRNIAATLIALTVFLAQIAPELAWIVILAGAFVFYGCRAAGCVLSTPLVSDITVKEEVPLFLSVNGSYFYISGVIMIVVISALLYWFESIWMLAGVIILGVLMGLTSSHYVRAVDETGDVRDAAKQNLVKGIKNAFAIPDVRRLAPAWFGVNLTIILVNSICTLTLKRGCGFSDTEALICSAIMFGAGAAASPISGKLCKHLGPKFVLKYSFMLYLTMPILWMMMPASGSYLMKWIFAAIIFIVIGIANICEVNAASTYFLMICPDKKILVPGSISIQLVTGVGAGLIGSFISSGLISLAGTMAQSANGIFGGQIGVFRIYFLLLVPIFIAITYLIFRLRKVILEFEAKYGRKAVEQLISSKLPWHWRR